MTTAVVPYALDTSPVRQALPFGLFSVAEFTPGPSHWELGVQWEHPLCDAVSGIGAWECAEGDTPSTTGLPKTLNTHSLDTANATAFTVYGHYKCSPVGTSNTEAQGKATQHLEIGEEARVEQALWTGDLGNTPTLSASTVVGSGTVGIAEGIGSLEQKLATAYGSLGVLHMTRRMAVLAQKFLVIRGGRITTVLGTPVVVGSGYDGSAPSGGTAASGGTEWVFATPALLAHRSDVFTSSNVAGDLLDRGVNDLYAVAERTYTLGWDDCGSWGVLIDPTV